MAYRRKMHRPLGLIRPRSLPPAGYRMAGGRGAVWVQRTVHASKNAGHLAASSLTRLAFKATVLAAARESADGPTRKSRPGPSGPLFGVNPPRSQRARNEAIDPKESAPGKLAKN